MNAHDYLPGTPAYNAVLYSQGKAAADAQLKAAIDAERNQTPLDTSTLDIFGNQIVTDPLAAPLCGANTIIGNSFWSFLKSPWVVLAVAVALFGALGGFGWIGRKIFK